MEKIIIMFVVTLLAAQIAKAQGTTTYLSNLGQSSAGSQAVGSDSWWATEINTGNNASGYALNSIQLGMANALGNPSGFTVMVTGQSIGGPAPIPGNSLGTLNGSLNPATSGTYTYTDDSNITLSPNTAYFIVLTSGTAVENNAYSWSYAGINSYSPIGGWSSVGGYFLTSSNGLSWHLGAVSGPQYAVNATPIPEPSIWLLFLLGSGVFLYVRTRKFRSA